MSASITERLADCLRRQIAWYRTRLVEQEAIEDEIQKVDMDALSARQAVDTRELKALADEYVILAREWNKTGNIPEEERDYIRQLKTEADQLLARVTEAHEEAVVLFREQHAEVGATIAKLHRGRISIGRYRVGDGGGTSGSLDSKA